MVSTRCERTSGSMVDMAGRCGQGGHWSMVVSGLCEKVSLHQ